MTARGVPQAGDRRRSRKFSRRDARRRRPRRGCSTSVRYVPGTFDDPTVYDEARADARRAFDEDAGQRLNRCFYLSTAPTFFPVIVGQLGEQRPEPPRGRRRAGRSSRSRSARPWPRRSSSTARCCRSSTSTRSSASTTTWARRRSRTSWRSGSPTGMFEPLWNRNYIDNIQITAAEDIGIGTRAGYYDSRRRAARPDPEPHAPAAVPRRDGAAGELHRRRGAQREGQGPPRDPRAVPGADRPRPRRARAVRRGRVGRRARRRLPRGGGRPAGLEHRDLRGDPPGGRQLALGRACRSTCAPASAWRARSPRSRSRCSPSPTSASRRTGSVGVQPNQLMMTMQPNEGVSLSLAAKIPGHAHADHAR